MSPAPMLLNDDGTASIATALMMSHHGFRRDLRRFSQAIDRIARGDTSREQALREEWQKFHATLHGHHESEDNGLFPHLSREQESLRATIEKLGLEHRRIDPLLERGDRSFAHLSKTDEAALVIRELRALLDPHLALEEAELIPFLRSAREFPPPPTDEVAAMYADGFAWAMDGVAPEVIEQVHEILPAGVRARLPAARAAFEARCERVWGAAKAGAAARTPIPDVVDG